MDYTVVQLWHVPSGKLIGTLASDSKLRRLPIHEAPLTQELSGLEAELDLATHIWFSPDGRLFTSHRDCTIRVWDPETNKETARLVGHVKGVDCLGFLSAPNKVISFDSTGQGFIWDINQPTVPKPFNMMPKQRVLSANRDLIVSLAKGPALKVTQIGDLKEILTLTIPKADYGHQRPSCMLSPDGKKLAFKCQLYDSVKREQSTEIRVWRLLDGKSLCTVKFPGTKFPVTTCACFSADSQSIVHCGEDELIGFLNIARGQDRDTSFDHISTVMDVAFSKDSSVLFSKGSRFTYGPDKDAVLKWDLKTGKIIERIRIPVDSEGATINNTGETIAVHYLPKHIGVFDLTTGLMLRKITGEHLAWGPLALSPDSRYLAAFAGTILMVWDIKSGQVVYQGSEGMRTPIGMILFSKDGRYLAWSVDAENVEVMDVAGWKTTGKLKLALTDGFSRGGSNHVCAFSADSQYLAIANGLRSQIDLWHLPTNTTTSLPQLSEVCWSLDFSPDGRLLATGGRKGLVCLWDVASKTLKAQMRLPSNLDSVEGLAFSPDCKYLAAFGRFTHSVFVYDVQRCLAQLGGPSHDRRRD
jgi:WD40 repeat protein